MAPKLKTSSIYFFRYSPVWKDKLHQWDKAPLVIPLEFYPNRTMLGVNIHWLPAGVRMKFIAAVLEIAAVTRGRGANKRLVPRLLYQMVKSNPQLRVGLVAIRKYYVRNMSNVQEVPPEMWSALKPSSGKYKPRIYTRPR